MNVLQVVPELNAGGVERTTLEIVEALKAAGYGAHVASAGGRMDLDLHDLGGQLHAFNVGSKNLFRLPGNLTHLVRIIQDNNIDIVHARSRAPAWPAYYAAKQTGRRFVTTYHGIYNAGNPLKRFYNGIMTRGEVIIANSNFTKNHIIQEHNISPDIVQTIYRAVDLARFNPSIIPHDRIRSIREGWGIPDGGTCLLLPGRLTRWKGQHVAVSALQHLSPEHVLVCLGDAQGRDHYVKELWDIAAANGVTDRLRIPGHTDNVPEALSAADIVISSSIEPEAFGRVAVEAQAMRKPVIATALGGALETVVNNKTGLLIKPADPQALAGAVRRMTGANGAYDGRAARARIEGLFSKHRLQTDTLALYDQLML